MSSRTTSFIVVYFAENVKQPDLGQRNNILQAVQDLMQTYQLPPVEVQPFLPIVCVTVLHQPRFDKESYDEYKAFIRHPGQLLSDDVGQEFLRLQMSARYECPGMFVGGLFMPGSIGTATQYEHKKDQNFLVQLNEIDNIVTSARQASFGSVSQMTLENTFNARPSGQSTGTAGPSPASTII
jgi:hypothetical protein